MYLSCWHVCWRWKRKILAAWGQYRSFYGALEHTGNINLLTFHLQTLGKPHSHKDPTLHSWYLISEKLEIRGILEMSEIWSIFSGFSSIPVPRGPAVIWEHTESNSWESLPSKYVFIIVPPQSVSNSQILCGKKCFSSATTLKLKFCGIPTFKAMQLSTPI